MFVGFSVGMFAMSVIANYAASKRSSEQSSPKYQVTVYLVTENEVKPILTKDTEILQPIVINVVPKSES